jgi:hypothetical protein
MEEYVVLAVCTAEDDTTVLESELDDPDSPVSVRPLPELSDLYDELCYSVVHCLLLPPSVDGISAANLAWGGSGHDARHVRLHARDAPRLLAPGDFIY